MKTKGQNLETASRHTTTQFSIIVIESLAIVSTHAKSSVKNNVKPFHLFIEEETMHRPKTPLSSSKSSPHFIDMNKRLEFLPNMALLILFTIAFFLFNSCPTMGRTQHALMTHKTTKSPHLQTYIVHVRHLQNKVFTSSEDRENWYRSFLPASPESSEEGRMVYSYTNAITGFAARLSE